jgi:hypothetical protein
MKSREIKKSATNLLINRAAINHERILTDAEAALERSGRSKTNQICTPLYGKLPWLVWLSGLAAVFLIILSWAVSFILSEKVNDLKNELELARRDVITAPADQTATINLYLREHQDVIARHASQSTATPQPLQMRVSQRDILYYEFFDDQPEFLNPGIIVRSPSYQHQSSPLEIPAISNGHSMTLQEARQDADFDLISPSWLYPGYSLDQIRRIQDRDALHLLYTDGANTLSLFEQPLDGQQGLSPQDFREYAVYRNQGQASRGTILAWRNDALSFVLIGNTEMSQLMDIAQSISAGK